MVNESRLERGSGEDVTYLELRGDVDGILTTVVKAAAEVCGGDFEMGIEELRGTLLSMEVLRRESGRLRLVSRVLLRFIDGGPLTLLPLYKLLVLFVKLRFEGGPIGGFVVIELLLIGILLGLVLRGVSGNFAISRSCWSCADSVELLC